ncbi:reverse transcriptase domain-containing protein, partial [Tanacetum coccineum]
TYTTYLRHEELKDHCLTLKNTPYPHQQYAVYNTLVNEEEQAGFTLIRCIHQEDTAYSCLLFTDNHEGLKTQYAVSRSLYTLEALLAGLVVSASKSMKDLHVFIDSLTLVAQIEGNHTPATEHERKYKEEIMDATAPFHSWNSSTKKFWWESRQDHRSNWKEQHPRGKHSGLRMGGMTQDLLDG